MANSTFLGIPLLSYSQSAKETTINDAVSYLERAMNDAKTIAFAGGNFTLPLLDLQRYFIFKTAGAGLSSVLSITATKRLFVIDNIANGNQLTVSCGTDTLAVPAGAIVVIYCDGNKLIRVSDSTVSGGSGGGVTTFTGLTDTFSAYTGLNEYVVRVKADLSGLEAVALAISDLSDVDLSGIDDGDVLAWSTTLTKFVPVPQGSGGGSVNLNAYPWKPPVSAATTGPVDLLDLIDGFVVDGITLAADNRVLVFQQVDQSENGIYVVQAGGAAPVRADDFDNMLQFPKGTAVAVGDGVTLKGSIYFVESEIGDINVDPIVFGTYVPLVYLTNLDDVDTSTPPADKQVLRWDGVEDVARFETIDFLPAATDPDDGKIVAWNKTLAAYSLINATAASYPPMTGKAGWVLSPNDDEDNVIWRELLPPVAITGMFAAGVFTNSELIFSFVTTDPFTIPAFAGSKAISKVASSGNVDLIVLKNGSQIGAIKFNASNVGAFSGAGASFVADDVLEITAPAVADSTLADVTVSIRGIRG